LEEASKLHKAEVTIFQNQITKLELELQRTMKDQEEYHKKNDNVQDEIYQMKTQVRDAEQLKETYEKEVYRLTEELKVLRETIIQKDDDLRQSMNSVYTMQKQVMEEKTSLWQELR
jgi:predicted  nucleic acid-binding Zn-ribbon protein